MFSFYDITNLYGAKAETGVKSGKKRNKIKEIDKFLCYAE